MGNTGKRDNQGYMDTERHIRIHEVRIREYKNTELQ